MTGYLYPQLMDLNGDNPTELAKKLGYNDIMQILSNNNVKE